MKNCPEKSDCGSRREFLVKSALVTGGVVLALSGNGHAFGQPFEDVTVAIDQKSPLSKVGGSLIVDSTAGKIIILRTGDAAFVAFSAKCTHKGGIVALDPASNRLVCPKHGSQFDATNGAVKEGPADTPLASHAAKGTAALVTVTVV